MTLLLEELYRQIDVMKNSPPDPETRAIEVEETAPKCIRKRIQTLVDVGYDQAEAELEVVRQVYEEMRQRRGVLS